MTFVLDASVTMAWCFEDESAPVSEAALDLLDEESAVTPAIWPLEVSNVLIMAQRRDRLTAAQAARFVALLNDLPISIDAVTIDIATILALGREHKLSAYDSAYLVLAEREGCALATLNAKLAQAARAAGVSLIGSS